MPFQCIGHENFACMPFFENLMRMRDPLVTVRDSRGFLVFTHSMESFLVLAESYYAYKISFSPSTSSFPLLSFDLNIHFFENKSLWCQQGQLYENKLIMTLKTSKFAVYVSTTQGLLQDKEQQTNKHQIMQIQIRKYFHANTIFRETKICWPRLRLILYA